SRTRSASRSPRGHRSETPQTTFTVCVPPSESVKVRVPSPGSPMRNVRSLTFTWLVPPSSMPPCVSDRTSWLVDVIAVHVTGPFSAARLTCPVFVPYSSTLAVSTTSLPALGTSGSDDDGGAGSGSGGRAGSAEDSGVVPVSVCGRSGGCADGPPGAPAPGPRDGSVPEFEPFGGG